MRIIYNNGLILVIDNRDCEKPQMIWIIHSENKPTQWIPRQTPLYIGKSEGCRAIHYFLISAIKIVGARSNRLSEAVTEAFRTFTHI